MYKEPQIEFEKKVKVERKDTQTSYVIKGSDLANFPNEKFEVVVTQLDGQSFTYGVVADEKYNEYFLENYTAWGEKALRKLHDDMIIDLTNY